MIGLIRTKTRMSGTRLILTRLRWATTQPSPRAWTTLLTSPSPSRCSSLWSSVRLGGVTGERHEHVVEGRPPQADVEHGDRLALEPLQHPQQLAGRAAADRGGQLAAVVADPHVVDRDLGQHPGRGLAVLDVGEHHLDPLATGPGLELVGRALRDRPPVVDHDDVVGELVGLLEVLRRQQQRRTARDQLPDDVPHAAGGCGRRGRWSARRAPARAARPPARPPGRAGGA